MRMLEHVSIDYLHKNIWCENEAVCLWPLFFGKY